MPVQVRSGHQSGFVDTTTEKLAIMSELEFFTKQFPLQVCIIVLVCVVCIYHNIYICDLN